MDNKIAGSMLELSKNMLESVATLQKINARVVKDLTKYQIESVITFIQESSSKMFNMGGIRTPQDAVTKQTEMAYKIGQFILSNAKRNMGILIRGQSEIKDLFENNINELTERTNAGDK